MFGHTLIRINSSFNSKLLSHAINYAANADQSKENGFIFAIKGLFGGYYGKYSILPYYDKLKEYRDTEQRDIWEYNLNLDKKEVMNMMYHIWELKDTYSYYYFFDENCSYNMLWLLEIARPSVHLRDEFIYQVSPQETLFAIDKAKLIKSIDYRASKRTKILAYEQFLDKNDVKIVNQLAIGDTKSYEENSTILDNQKKIFILETAIELLEYNYIQRKLSKEDYIQASYFISNSRSKLGQTKKDIIIEKPENPLLGHRQLRVSLQSKYNHNNYSTLFGIRPSLHDLKDNDTGYLKGTQIEFFNLMLEYDKNLKVDSLHLLTLSSFVKDSKFFHPLSWNAEFNFDRESLNEELNFYVDLGAGYSFNLWDNGYFYTMLDGYLIDSAYSNSAVSYSLGMIFDNSSRYKTNIEYKKKLYDSKDIQDIFNATQSYNLTKDLAFQVEYKHIDKFKKDEDSYSLKINYSF